MQTETKPWVYDDLASRKLAIVGALLDKTADILEELDRNAPPELQAELGKAFRYVLIAIEEIDPLTP